MPREISSYSIAPAIKQKLIRAGYSTDACLAKSTPLSLAKDTSISKEDALSVLKLVRHGQNESANTLQCCTAQTMAQKEQSMMGIVTFSQKIDTMLGDGIPLGKLTEFCGIPGIGKTQISMQLCVDATIPEYFGGVQGQAIYIDTEGSFVAERVAQISAATVNHCHMVAKSAPDEEMEEELKEFTVEKLMKSIHYFRCTSCVELLALVHLLPQFIADKCNNNVKVIVVDSFAFHFRHNWDDMSSRTRTMSNLAQQLMKMASKFQLAVVLVNQMTTKVAGTDSKVVPALGESWSHVATNRIQLLWRNGIRYANLFKSPNRKEDTVPYCITTDGIRDVDEWEGDLDELPTKRFKMATT